MPAPSRQDIIDQDVRDLARLGYAQQLYREMGGFSNFAISFSIISVLTGAVLLYGYGLKRFGPVINVVAILWVIAITIVFALPPNELVLWTMLLVGVLLAAYWQLSARRRFVGPAAARP